MNHDPDDNLASVEGDPLVSAEYRAIARERTPVALDAAVLRTAGAATSRLRRFTAFWFRPLAFVATLALSLALVLELTGTRQLEPAHVPAAGRPDAEAFGSAPDAGQPRAVSEMLDTAQPPADAGRRVPGSNEFVERNDREAVPMTEPTNAPAVDEVTSADFADVIEQTSKSMPGTDSVTRNAARTLGQTRPETRATLEEVVVSGSFIDSDAPARACSEQVTNDPDTWWQCIADLEKAGRHAEASIELGIFRAAHPDFEAPRSSK